MGAIIRIVQGPVPLNLYKKFRDKATDEDLTLGEAVVKAVEKWTDGGNN